MLLGERTDKVEGSDKAVIVGNCQSIAMETIVFFFLRYKFQQEMYKINSSSSTFRTCIQILHLSTILKEPAVL